MPVTHQYVNPVADDPAEAALNKTLPSHWNADHTVADVANSELATMPAATIKGNDAAGDATPQDLTAAEVRTLLGLSASGTGAVNSVSNSDSTLTISPTTGAVVASLNLANANTWTANQVIRTGGDRTTLTTDYTGTAASISSGTAWIGTFNGTEKVSFGWLSPTNTSASPHAPPQAFMAAFADPVGIYTFAAKDIFLGTGDGSAVIERARLLGADGSGSKAGNFGIGVSNPTATLHLKAGSSTAGTAPLKLTSGTLLGTAEAGGVEFLTDKFYGTITTDAARKELTLNDAALTAGRIPYTTTNGRITDSSSLVWDSANVMFGVGGTPVVNALHIIKAAAAAGIEVAAENTNTTGFSGFANRINGSNVGAVHTTGSTWSTSGIFVASAMYVYGAQSAGIYVGNTNASGSLTFFTGGAATTNERAHVDAAGNFVVGRAALATNATDGFLYVPTCAGTPTGTPTAKTGCVALVFDTTNNKLYVYDGGWIDVT